MTQFIKVGSWVDKSNVVFGVFKVSLCLWNLKRTFLRYSPHTIYGVPIESMYFKGFNICTELCDHYCNQLNDWKN